MYGNYRQVDLHFKILPRCFPNIYIKIRQNAGGNLVISFPVI